MSGYRPPEPEKIIKPSKTSKYFVKKGVKKVKRTKLKKA
jgi:hypothetical protein